MAGSGSHPHQHQEQAAPPAPPLASSVLSSVPQPPQGPRPTEQHEAPLTPAFHAEEQQQDSQQSPHFGGNEYYADDESVSHQHHGQTGVAYTNGVSHQHIQHLAMPNPAEIDFQRVERNKDHRVKELKETLKMLRILINLAEEEEERIKAKTVIDNTKLDHIYDVKDRLKNIESQIVIDSEAVDIDKLDQDLDAAILRYGWAAEITRRGYFSANAIQNLVKLGKALDKVTTIAEPEDELKQVLKAIEAYADAEHKRVGATKDYMPWTTTNKTNKQNDLEDAKNIATSLYAALSTNKLTNSDGASEDISRDGIRKKTQELLSQMQQDLQAKRHAWFDFCIRILTLGFFRSESTTLQNLKKMEESLRKDMLLSSKSTRLNIASEINLAETQKTMEHVKQSLGVPPDIEASSAQSSPHAQHPRSVSFAPGSESKHGGLANGTSSSATLVALSAASPRGPSSALKKKAEPAATDPVATAPRELSGAWNKLTKKVNLASSAHTRHFVVLELLKMLLDQGIISV